MHPVARWSVCSLWCGAGAPCNLGKHQQTGADSCEQRSWSGYFTVAKVHGRLQVCNLYMLQVSYLATSLRVALDIRLHESDCIMLLCTLQHDPSFYIRCTVVTCSMLVCKVTAACV